MVLTVKEIRKRYERYKKKKVFIKRLKKGKGTDDPGPMRVTGSTGPM